MPDFRDSIDLASERLGGSVLYANDDFFAEKENLLKPGKAVWKEHEYTDRGKWMDGWESRRKRVPGHDFAIVRLGLPGVIDGVVVDTSYFRGNYPAQCSIEACSMRPETDVETLLSEATDWTEILPQSDLQGDSENLFEVDCRYAFTHLRFHIYPDGGVARLRVHGQVVPDWRRAGTLANEQDLAAVENGGDVLECSDMFFGPKHNLIMPGRAHNMSDGWETRRRRGPGHDWVVVQLATEGVVRRVEVDTNHFKGNFPDTCSLEARRDADGEWFELLPRTKLLAHTRHLFIDELTSVGPVSQVRLNVYPDGGVSRLRVHAQATVEGRQRAVVRHLNTVVEERAAAELRSCCGSTGWVRRMLAARPFAGWQALATAAEVNWRELPAAEWLEAFAAHPRIGAKKAAPSQSLTAARWSSGEQSRANDAAAETLAQLAEVNRAYEERFGRIYIVCATGRSAEELLAIARSRLANDPETELRIAAEEQLAITMLRLMKLV